MIVKQGTNRYFSNSVSLGKLFILEIVMVFFMYRNIAFWIKFICKHHWFGKDLRKSLKLLNNNYGVLLMKHFQVYRQSETI